MRGAWRVSGRRGPVARLEREPGAQVASGGRRPRTPAIEATPVDDKVAGAFVALQLPAPPTAQPAPDIRIELRRGATTVSIAWPGQAAGECAAWLGQWLR